jgi:hypothetical protein
MTQLLEALAGHGLTGSSLHFIAQWGLSREASFDDNDVRTLDYLAEGVRMLADAAGVEQRMTLLIMDSHAAVNGIGVAEYERYALDVRNHATGRGIDCANFLDIARDGGLTMQRIESEGESFDEHWGQLSDFTREEMNRRAFCHSHRGGDVKEAGKLYFCVSKVEAAILSAAFCGAVLVTFHTPNFAFLLPNLPTVFTYAGPMKSTQRPWFKYDGAIDV